jgi:hypothetical protein
MSTRRDSVSSLAGWRGVSLKRFRAADPATPELPTPAGLGSCIVNVAATATSPALAGAKRPSGVAASPNGGMSEIESLEQPASKVGT